MNKKSIEYAPRFDKIFKRALRKLKFKSQMRQIF